MTQPAIIPVLDIPAILAGLQDQVDELTATVHAQQEAIENLLRLVTATPSGAAGASARGTAVRSERDE